MLFVAARTFFFVGWAVVFSVTSNGVHAADECEPEQLMLTLGTPAESSVWVSWFTPGNCTTTVVYGEGSELSSSTGTTTLVGDAPHKYTHTTRGAWSTYTPYNSSFIHQVNISGLAPNTQYVFKAGGSNGSSVFSSWAPERTFRTQRSPGDSAAAAGDGVDPLRVTVIGDVGQTDYSKRTVEEILNLTNATYLVAGDVAPSHLMIVGDLSYADGFGPRWDSWGLLFSPLLSRLPMVAFPGNHEIEEDYATGEFFKHFRQRFRMPEVAPEYTAAGKINSWHSYDMDLTYDYGSSFFSYDSGRAHFICLNSYTHSEEGSAQYNWVMKDLASVDRRVTPWIFVFVHGPWYNSNNKHQDEVATLTMKEAMEDLFHGYQVAAMFAGHVHAYERTRPVYRENVDWQCGTTYVTIGDGGNREELYDEWSYPAEEWVAFRNGSKYGRGDLLVINDTHTKWGWWPNAATSPQDETWIVNPLRNQWDYNEGTASWILVDDDDACPAYVGRSDENDDEGLGRTIFGFVVAASVIIGLSTCCFCIWWLGFCRGCRIKWWCRRREGKLMARYMCYVAKTRLKDACRTLCCLEMHEEQAAPAWLVEAREAAKAYKAQNGGGFEETAETPDAPGPLHNVFGGGQSFAKLPTISTASIQLPSFGEKGVGLATREVRSWSEDDAEQGAMEAVVPGGEGEGEAEMI